MPKLIMLVGLPGCGKSTLRNMLCDTSTYPFPYVYSTDDFIQYLADKEGLTYNEQFSKETLKKAKEYAKKCLNYSTPMHDDIIWDQTNLTKKSRASKLKKIPSDYRKVAVYFEPNIEKCFEINKKREVNGRSIPPNVLSVMIATIEKPTEDEGFDKILVIKSWEELNELSKEDLVNL